MAKAICNPDDTLEFYNKETDTEPAWTAKIPITESCNDSDGNLWIKTIAVWNEDGSTYYFSSKYSNSGTVWEMVASGVDYPDELSPIAGNHLILYSK